VSVADVHGVLDALRAVGGDPRLTGGWGVDALIGEQTRDHRDLDPAIRAEATVSAVAALQEQGFSVTTDWLPVRIELSCHPKRRGITRQRASSIAGSAALPNVVRSCSVVATSRRTCEERSYASGACVPVHQLGSGMGDGGGWLAACSRRRSRNMPISAM
jgi:hypothetical protein